MDTVPPSVHRELQNPDDDDDDDVTVMKNFVINIRFADHVDRQLPDPRVALEELFNGDCASGLDRGIKTCEYAPTGSVKDHFLWNSHGKFRLESTVFPWVTVGETEKEYADGYYGCTGYFVKAIVEALELLDTEIDFSEFDMDGDGFVDAVTVLHSGYASEWGGQAPCGESTGNKMLDRIWSHKWDLGAGCSKGDCPHPKQIVNERGAWKSNEGTKVLNYHVSPSLWGICGNKVGRIGVIVHETLHFLGLPDMYDGTGGKGLGSFCTMGNSWGWDGSQHYPPMLNPWAKWHLGWIEYTPLASSGTYELAPSSASKGAVYQISDGYDKDSADRPREYLLVENRRALGYEKKLPREGVVVWHVDEPELRQSKRWNEEGHPGQDGWPSNGKHYLVALLPADRAYKLENGRNNGDRYDVIAPGSDFALGPGPGDHPNTDTYLDGIVRSTGIKLWDFDWVDEGDAGNLDVRFKYENPHAGAAPSTIASSTIGTGKTDYESDERVDVKFDSPSAESGDKVALYAGDGTFGDTISADAIEWLYACGDKSCNSSPTTGTVTFSAGSIPEGSYRALLIRGSSSPHSVLASSSIFSYHPSAVAPTPSPVTEAEVYLRYADLVSGAPVEVEVCCSDDRDWFAIVSANHFNDDGTVNDNRIIDWSYCCGEQDHGKCAGKMHPCGDDENMAVQKLTRKTLSPGDYKVMVTHDQVAPYNTVAISETLHVSAPDVTTTIRATKEKFIMPGERIACTFDHPAANVDDWLAIYASTILPRDGKMPAGAVADWEYICGSQNLGDCKAPVQSATVEFNHDLPPYTYACYVLRNGPGREYDVIASSEPFAVSKPAKAGACKSWCPRAAHPWRTKCTWVSCSGCKKCSEGANASAAAMSVGLSSSGEEIRTLTEGGGVNRGIVFDVDAQVPLEVRSFSLSIAESDSDMIVRIYTKKDSYEGHEDNPDAWTLICESQVKGMGTADLTEISDCSPVKMDPGEARSFYMEVGARDLHLTPSFFPEGTVFARNDDLSIMVGKGISGNFGRSTCQRQFNGAIGYVPEGVPNPGSTTYPIGGNANGNGVGSTEDDPVDGKLGSDCYCDDCKEGTCGVATNKCENEDTG
uniref:Peptidase M6-like domain-containing protein n=1 Tax=Odontella aurita TaxID=265563 RepID=A0A7S4K228_9STRA